MFHLQSTRFKFLLFFIPMFILCTFPTSGMTMDHDQKEQPTQAPFTPSFYESFLLIQLDILFENIEPAFHKLDELRQLHTTVAVQRELTLLYNMRDSEKKTSKNTQARLVRVQELENLISRGDKVPKGVEEELLLSQDEDNVRYQQWISTHDQLLQLAYLEVLQYINRIAGNKDLTQKFRLLVKNYSLTYPHISSVFLRDILCQLHTGLQLIREELNEP